LNIRDANIHEAADFVGVGERAQRYRRLIRGGPAPNVHNEPGIRDLNVPGRALAVASAQNAAAENLFIEIRRSINVSDGDKKRDGEPVAWGHLIALLLDLNAHWQPQFR
jgi:hypothetical protein